MDATLEEVTSSWIRTTTSRACVKRCRRAHIASELNDLVFGYFDLVHDIVLAVLKYTYRQFRGDLTS